MSIPDYTPTNWVDNVTPVDESRMDHIELGLDAVNAGYNALEARVVAEEAQPNVPSPVVNGQWIKGSGGALIYSAIAIADVTGLQAALDAKEDDANRGAANGYAPLDATGKVPTANLPPVGADLAFEGDWSAATAYTDGDVVVYQGVSYMALEPSTNVAPVPWGGATAGTVFPTTPYDGQEFVLTDSLTTPTFAWKFRYFSAKASNKWVFVGGARIEAEVATAETTTSATYVALTTAGPTITLPIAGDYLVEIGYYGGVATNGAVGYMSYDIGVTAAVDADSLVCSGEANRFYSQMRMKKKLALGAVALTAKYKSNGTATSSFQNRWMAVTPIAVGG